MEYLDFELKIALGAGRAYPVSVVKSPAGEASGTMQFPFDTLALQNQLQGVEIALLKSGSTRRDVVRRGAQVGQRVRPAAVRGAHDRQRAGELPPQPG
jgi:hypothetical protein